MDNEEVKVPAEEIAVEAEPVAEAPAKKYFGVKAIKASAESSDGRIVSLLYEDETQQNIPKWEFDALTSESPLDEVSLRNERANVMAQKVLAILLEFDYPVVEVDFLLEKVKESLFNDYMPGTFHRAMDTLISKATNGVVKRRRDLRLADLDAMLTE